MNRRRIAVALLLALAGGAPVTAAGGLVAWNASTLEKVRPFDPPRAPSEGLAATAARNEFEPVQLVLWSARGIPRIDVEVSDFVGRGVRRVPPIPARNATVYLERFVALAQPSSESGAGGEWPDPLVPRVDRYAGERRDAFPFDLAARRSQPLWLELYVPRETPPATYRAEVVISSAGAPLLRLPWTVRVRSFALPSTSSLPTTFGFSGISALKGHFGRYTDDTTLLRLSRVYARAALRHRLSLHEGSQIPPPATYANGQATIDWRLYDREMAPFLDGTVFGPADPLPGARATTVDVRTPAGLDDDRTIAYWRAWVERFEERGWLDRLFLYLWDEPTEDDYGEVARRGRLARRADPRLRTLLTEVWTPELADVVDLWTPLVNCVELPSGDSNPCVTGFDDAARTAIRKRGGRVFWYQSCESHGCNEIGDAELARWPSYAIDAPAVAARRMPWESFRRGIEGELYFNTVEAYASGPDPWRDPRRHGGNGDGTLFYPGTPKTIGGRTHIPVESLRLKLIREGLEDYEYLTLLATMAGRERALALASSAFETGGGPSAPEAIERAREAIADDIEARLARPGRAAGGR